MVGHGGSSAGSYLTDPTSPIPSHYASIVATSTLRVNKFACRKTLNVINGCINNAYNNIMVLVMVNHLDVLHVKLYWNMFCLFINLLQPRDPL